MPIIRPRILPMDESFGMLDTQRRRMMRTLLRAIGSRIGATMLFVTPLTHR
ncbi:hypothetical protein [Burkholderia sp. RF2-non_BP3]|uniref:hypothetical protein n=1 Tax=Burkholderia sp. RF2-non_BP3 TaxID=1637844 RepID=UPI000A47F1F8|nr:hypothetical protein [Burkholderia sp. RF2-non_BP3]